MSLPKLPLDLTSFEEQVKQTELLKELIELTKRNNSLLEALVFESKDYLTSTEHSSDSLSPTSFDEIMASKFLPQGYHSGVHTQSSSNILPSTPTSFDKIMASRFLSQGYHSGVHTQSSSDTKPE